jgi:hypothetical protein
MAQKTRAIPSEPRAFRNFRARTLPNRARFHSGRARSQKTVRVFHPYARAFFPYARDPEIPCA